jgi:BirA family transcriptional regulator, biotin operon repressor / biotin---[acetyl-CoA-carboxylase] ligase
MGQMDLSRERLQAALGQRAFDYYPQIGSTNDRALAWLTEGASAGSIVIADEQTQGRGRMGRAWYAPPGTALMLSYLLRPAPNDLAFVGMMGALAVCETVESFGAQVGIKWPNDVQIDGRKLCGILPEASWQDGRLMGALMGIGLNVRIDFSGTLFEQSAVSLETAVGQVDRVEVLVRLLERLDYWSVRLASDALFDAWRDRLVMLGRRVAINDISGLAESVDRQGALLVRDDGGTLRWVIAGDISLG